MKGTLEKAFGYQNNNMNRLVRDLEAALPFYEKVFGFQVLSRAETPHNSAIHAVSTHRHHAPLCGRHLWVIESWPDAYGSSDPPIGKTSGRLRRDRRARMLNSRRLFRNRRNMTPMTRFKCGDRVRREMTPTAGYVRTGTIIAVIPNDHELQIFDQYEVDFGANGVLIAYDSQLEAA